MPLPRIEMVYDRTCPNVEECRASLRAALIEIGAPPVWSEWDRNAEETPTALRGFGSPTVLIDGRDICGCSDGLGAVPIANSCRVYRDDRGALCGVPSVQLILAALTNGKH